MRISIGAVGFFLLLASALQAQDHCPPGGQKKDGNTPTISWTSYLVNTNGSICVERTVHTKSLTYVNWPVAEMNQLWVNGDWTTKRCCFSDSTLKDGDLEYGLLGRKIHTSVYQGYNETADNTTLGIFGKLQNGEQLAPVGLEAIARNTCAKPKEDCQVRYTIKNSKSPLVVTWKDEPIEVVGQWVRNSKEVVIQPGATVSLKFAKVAKAGAGGVSVMTIDHKPLATLGRTGS